MPTVLSKHVQDPAGGVTKVHPTQRRRGGARKTCGLSYKKRSAHRLALRNPPSHHVPCEVSPHMRRTSMIAHTNPECQKTRPEAQPQPA